jgi:hypothetical protein
MADLQRMLQIEKDIPQVIDNYINNENARLDELRRLVFVKLLFSISYF